MRILLLTGDQPMLQDLARALEAGGEPGGSLRCLAHIRPRPILPGKVGDEEQT